MNTLTIPVWTNGLPNHLKLYSEDVMEFYGLKSTRGNIANLYREIKSGRIPEPLQLTIKAGSRKNYWLLGDMRKLKKEMEA